MSYCRFGKNSDIYLFGDSESFDCCGCQLLQGTYPSRRGTVRFAQNTSVRLTTRSAAILHLRHHKLYGHKVPGYAEKILLTELKTIGEYNEYGKLAKFNHPWPEYRAATKRDVAKLKSMGKKRKAKE